MPILTYFSFLRSAIPFSQLIKEKTQSPIYPFITLYPSIFITFITLYIHFIYPIITFYSLFIQKYQEANPWLYHFLCYPIGSLNTIALSTLTGFPCLELIHSFLYIRTSKFDLKLAVLKCSSIFSLKCT